MTAVLEQEVTVWQDQVATRVQTAGDGPPLIFFHGEAGLQWDPLLESLAENHRVYAPMHPGTDGKHPEAVRAVRSVSDLVLCYAELFDALDLDHAVVVGHSFGGMIAAEFAATYPKFVDRLVLISPFGLWRDDAPIGNWMMLDPAQVLQATFADPQGPVAQQVAAGFAALATQPEAAAAQMWVTACTGHYLWPLPDRGLGRRIHRISAPALVLWGQQDGIIPAVYAEEFGRRLANSTVEVIDGAGHLPQLEQPEIVTKLVREFLDG